MNLTKAEKARLGAFVATGVLVLVGSVASIAGLKVFEKRDLYIVRFSESVGGLEASAQVKYQGLRVGRVETMRIAPDDPGAIEVTLSLEEGTQLREGTTAVMDASGLTGLKTVNLTPGDPKGKLLPPGSIIPAGKSFFEKLTGQAEAITLKVEQVANQLVHWTGDENRARVERLIDNMNKLIADVDGLVVETKGPLTKALVQFDETGEALKGTAVATTKTLNDVRDDLRGTLAEARASLAETQRILKAIDGKQLAQTVSAASAAMEGLNARVSSAELGETITRLGVTLANLSKLLSESELAVRAGREDFVMSLKAIRQASEDLREFSRIIAQDPSVLLRGKDVGE